MPDVKISQLPQRTAQSTDFVPVIDSSGTTTYKAAVSTISAVGGGPPASHTHGNLTNAGAIGSTADLPIKTGASGVLQAGAFGTTAGTFCQGNDSRLSDSRTPVSHAASHASNGADPIALVIPNTITLSATANDWLPNSGDGDIFKVTASASGLSITGISATMKAKAVLICNTGATNAITLTHEGAGSAAANRIVGVAGQGYTLSAGNSVALFYDAQSSRWRVIA